MFQNLPCYQFTITSQKNLDIIFTPQKKSIRILNSVNYNVHTNPLFLENKIIEFPDIIIFNQLLFINQFINNNLPEDLKNIIRFSNCIHNHSAHISERWFIYSPNYINKLQYGIYSLSYGTLCME